MKNKVFVSESNLDLRKRNPIRIKLIGIAHGQTPVAPMGVRTEKIVKQQLAEEKGLILAEGTNRSFIPMKFKNRAIDLEKDSSILTFILLQIPRSLRRIKFLEIQKESVLNYLGEFFVKIEKVDGVAPREIVDKLTLDSVEKRGRLARWLRVNKISKEQFYNGMRLLTTGRSLLLSASVLNEAMNVNARKEANSVSVVIGASHMPEMKKFIENPNLALRYLKKVEKALRKVPDSEKIVQDLNRAKQIFKVWKTRLNSNLQ